MIAYHGNQSEKDAILAQLEAHYQADEIVKGQYWESGKGCAVGCTLHSSNHAEYEPRFGIPAQLAHLEDRIFENLPNGHAKEWPLKFMRAIRPGADLRQVWPQFAAWLMDDPEHGVLQYAKGHADCEAEIKEVARLYREGGTLAQFTIAAAAAARWAAADDAAAADAAVAAAAAADAAVDAAHWAAAAADAASASAAADDAAAASAAASAAAHWAAAARWADARGKSYQAMADKLISLLEAA